ncbi:TetR family transcriptional regulator [Arthrobacter sp. MYb211]|uniref:TetR/AcrR family transcriptional regulator C-terminal domain-containing protein n=1 Tax=Micrococcaceae TaxID=1268 RepID=UPI000CFD89F7|nr:MULTISPECIES: TetR/AcrR family transcriptional regulator C-terminal domain-containing protein [unclassified Arthrobacter]PRA04520.1 TetR family transcriptional regulator [Arthrobacter sp. MYb229]PRA12253.1 TetR family transcriptional regulator [Arthrobacter sp. MYb221]PRB51567.1 TetR family transcriptional regulator [Arthrobacter sp. MYb216]PRC08715.1 TetR family transcriptional regulator [Arthrobacter sp. MYb211]
MARPSKPKLSAIAIADAALKLVDAHGEFTLPHLAKALSVTASSLYNHVDGKAGIIELMRGRAMSEIQLPDLDRVDWQEAVRQIATEYWASYAKHPKLIPLFTSHTVRDQTTLRVYEALAEAFAMAGFAPKERLQAITIIDSFVLGSALDAAAPKEVWLVSSEASTAFSDALDAGLNVEGRPAKAFSAGLEIVLSGFERKFV